MPDANSRFFAARLPFFLVLALLPCLLSNSCASTTSTRAAHAEKGLSPSAETDYRFLVYQDLLRQGKKDEAAKALEQLAERFPSPDIAVELANLQWGQNEREKATATLEKALAAFPDARELTFYLANAYQMRRMTDEAYQTLQRFLDKHPNDAPAVRELASVLHGTPRAARRAQRGVELDRLCMTAPFCPLRGSNAEGCHGILLFLLAKRPRLGNAARRKETIRSSSGRWSADV